MGRPEKIRLGDTLIAHISARRTERVRLIGIDAPEVGACFSNEATTLARATRMGASIALPRSTPAKTLAAVIARLLR